MLLVNKLCKPLCLLPVQHQTADMKGKQLAADVYSVAFSIYSLRFPSEVGGDQNSFYPQESKQTNYNATTGLVML